MRIVEGDGLGVEAVAERLNTTPKRVSVWSVRFAASGLDGLADKPGRGRKPSIPGAKVARVITEATRPPQGRSRWSIRSMSRHAGISASSVQRIWSNNDLKPHRLRTFKLSNDPQFEDKFWDVVGLYLNPPEKALVLCCDEKSQCQALERTQLGLPLAPKRPRTMTHDYVRHGTMTLFAALEVLEGKVVGQCFQRTPASRIPSILARLDQGFSGETPLHLVMDNYGTHKHPRVQTWLQRRPRFVPHFVPTSSSWLNLVERWFGELTSKRIRRGSFGSVEDLEKAIAEFLAVWNEKPKPFVWTATVASIKEKLSHCRQTLEKIQPGCTQPRKRNTQK